MKKSLIALAALTAFAGAASAQSSVVIGGYIDLGVGKPTGTADKQVLDGGGTDGSRLNFNAIEDLGGGLRAQAGFEHRLRPDTGASAPNFWNGYSFIGLQGGFGRIRVGRDYTTAFSFAQNQVDPFAGDTVAVLRQNSLQIGAAKVRFANGIRYDSPAMGGLTFAFDISEKGLSQNNGAPADATNVNKPWSASVAYAAGPMYLALSHENPGGKNDKLTNVAARYTMGGLTLRAGAANGTNNANAKVKGYLLGANYAMGAGNFKVGYATNKIGTVDQAKRFAVGYQYNMSKRTFLYTDFVSDSKLKTQKTGYDFGVRHQF
jgi:predicted porin